MRLSISTFSLLAIAASSANVFGVANVAPTGSGVQAYFGSQSNAFTDSFPLTGPWGTPGFGPYPTGATIPGVPGAPPPGSYPSFPGTAFQTFGLPAAFNDLAPGTANTSSNSFIIDSYLPTATLVEDAYVFTPFWTINQGATAVGYAYHQFDFGAAYQVTGNTGLAGSTPNIPLFIFGSVATGGYVQFDGVVTYSFLPLNADGTSAGPLMPLGSLNYNFLQTAGTTFASPIPSTGALSAIGAQDGILEITGHFWLAGDPFNATIVPEPVSLSLIGFSAGLLRRRRKAI